MQVVIACAMSKGGTAKSTLSWALCSILSEAYRVLAWDFDSQLTLTMALTDQVSVTGYDVLTGKAKIQEAISKSLPSYPKNLKIISASRLLVKLDAETNYNPERHYLVADALKEIRDQFDFIIVDCPSSQDILTIAPLVAATHCLSPCSTADASFQQVDRFMGTIKLVSRRLNPDLIHLPLVASIFSKTQVMDQQVLKALKDKYRVFKQVIPKRVAIKEEMAARIPCSNEEFRALVSELLGELNCG